MFIKTNSSITKYPYSLEELYIDNPSVIFPADLTEEVLAEWDVYRVYYTEPPEHNQLTESARQLTPVKDTDGLWKQVWEVVPATPQEISERTQAIRNDVVLSTQQRLDSFAKTRYYDGMLSLCTYATSTNTKFSVEGQYGVEVRDATWAKLYEILAEVEAGTRPMPSGYAAIESELPVLQWPN